MFSMLAGFVIAAALWWGLKAYGQADPKVVARALKRVGGGAALLLAAVLAVRGRFDMAALAGGVGAWLLGWSEAPAFASRFRGPFGGLFGRRASGPRSRLVELRSDGSGRVRGRVLAGPWAGRDLDALSAAELSALRDACRRDDPEGVGLIDAYLDGRQAGGREHAHADGDARRRPDPQRGAMTEEEAHQILGLQPGAGAGEIRAAHRALMKKLHPDQGGSTYLASRINQARDLLLDRHR